MALAAVNHGIIPLRQLTGACQTDYPPFFFCVDVSSGLDINVGRGTVLEAPSLSCLSSLGWCAGCGVSGDGMLRPCRCSISSQLMKLQPVQVDGGAARDRVGTTFTPH